MLNGRRTDMRGRAGVIGRAVLVVAGLGLLASCASAPTSSPKTKFSEAEYGVKASPKMVAMGKPVPKGGGRSMVGKPYRVAGKTYVPRDNPNYSATGLASWYGPNFHGRKTANGEVFDMNDLTAAHPTLPLPSYVRVTNLSNGRSVVVRVNDRGPFAHNRVIDVSATTASVLDFKRAGVAKVKVDYVGPARMDGRDRDMLMASYSGPGAQPRTMVASRKPLLSSRRVVVASAAPSAPMAIAPAKAKGSVDDQIGPLILRSGFVSSYAETDRFTPAHAAAAKLATGGTLVAHQFSKPETPRPVAAGTAVQLGVFSDPANAAKVGARFKTYGTVVITDQVRDGRTLQSVRVVIADASVAPATVINAAAAAGLSGAFVVSR